ncbi:MAG: carboxypeptidase regulatory-like domain-containing protein [Acidobacteriota bacterium]|nr:carboxypeptidase regulatory-like domain-containing protein [Acidobacteriota bacterium]
MTLSLGSVERVLACSCVLNILPCQRYGSSDAIFIGKAIDVKKEKAKDENGKEINFENESTIFEVEEVLLGTRKKQVAVRNKSGTSCDTYFTQGETYLVFANGDDKKGYGTGYCSGNTLLSEARESLTNLRNLPLIGAGGKLYGNISESLKKRSEEFVSMSGVNIKIQEIGGKRKIYKAVSDGEGNYELIVLQGKYKVIPTIPAYAELGLFSDEPVFVKDRGCAEKSFTVENNAQITGKVIDAQGKPVAEIWIEFVSVDNEKPDFLGDESGQSDENGEFTIYNVPSGRYTLSVNFTGEADEEQPFPTTFYPNASVREDAKVFEIGLGQTVDNLIFRLPPRIVKQKIYGTVVFPDGRPATEMTVNLQRDDSDRSFSRTRTDKNGNFVLNGFTGEKYNFGIEYYGEEIEKRDYTIKKSVFTLDKNMPSFRLVLEKKSETSEKP